MIKTITTDALKEALLTGTDQQLIDVREVHEYEEGHIEEAKNMPLSSLDQSIQDLNKNDSYLIICQKGGRSMRAAEYLHSQGYDVTNVDGGMDDWSGNTVQ